MRVTFVGSERPAAGMPGQGLAYGGVQAGAILVLYLGISFLDPWGYVPEGIHAALYGLMLALMGLLVLAGFSGRRPRRLAAPLKTFGISILLVGVFALLAGEDAGRRLEIALKPRALFTYPIPHMTARLVPPPYTEAESMEISGVLTAKPLPDGSRPFPAAGINPVPEGSLLTVRIDNIRWRPVLVAEGRVVPFERGEDGSYEAQLTLREATDWQVRTGSYRLGRWPVILVQDEAPEIRDFALGAETTPLGLTPLQISLADDYALKRLSLEVREPENPDMAVAHLDLPVSGVTEFSGTLYVDLSAVDMAGRLATVTLVAEDEAGQASRVGKDAVLLPKRFFHDAEADLLNDIREKLLTRPEDRQTLARKVMALGLVPDQAALRPPVYYMALRSAYWRLVRPAQPGDWQEARKILWDLALLLEYGESGQKELALLQGLDRLALALRQNKSPEAILRHLQELDHDFSDFVRVRALSDGYAQQTVPDYLVVRRLYDRILGYVSRNDHEHAIALVDNLRQALVNDDLAVLTSGGYGRYVAASQGAQIVDNLITIQKQLLANSYKGRIVTELASTDRSSAFEARISREWKEWGQTQKRLGQSLSRLGLTLSKTGIETEDLLAEADRLVRDTLSSLEAGEMESAAQYQSQILVVLNNLKHRLGANIPQTPLIRELAPSPMPDDADPNSAILPSQ